MRGITTCRVRKMVFLAAIVLLGWLLFGYTPGATADDRPGDGDEEEASGGGLSRLEEWGLELHGELESEIVHESGFADPEMGRSSETNGDLTLDLDLTWAPCDWFTGEIAVSWDDEDGDDFERVLATFGNPEEFPAYFSIGRTILPFGPFESNMISDPFPLDIAETTTEAALLGIEWGPLQAVAYTYDGTPTRDQRGHGFNVFGGTIQGAFEGEEVGLQVGAGWLEHIADSDDLELFYREERLQFKNRVPAATLYSLLTLDPFRLGFEYVGSLKHPKLFEQDEEEGEILTRRERLEAWSCEASFEAELPEGMETILAVAYSRSKGLVDFLPKKSVGGTITVFPLPHWKIALEYLREFDYPVFAGGTGDVADIFTIQTSWEF